MKRPARSTMEGYSLEHNYLVQQFSAAVTPVANTVKPSVGPSAIVKATIGAGFLKIGTPPS